MATTENLSLPDKRMPQPPSGSKAPFADIFKSRLVVILLGILGLLLVFLVSLFVFSHSNSPPETQPQPTLNPSPFNFASLSPRQPSEFSKSAAFQSFETDLSALKDQNATIDLSEANLTFPLLDMQVNFDKR